MLTDQKKHLQKLLKNISTNIFIPRFLTDQFRTSDEVLIRSQSSKRFDNLDTFFTILKSRFIDIKNSLLAIESKLDRNNLKIEELEKNKNDKLNFLAYSENFTSLVNYQNPILTKSLDVSTGMISGIIADEDSGIEFTEHKDNDKHYIKINVDKSKLDGIKFISSSSVKIVWNKQANAYELLQNDIFQYNSSKKEKEITIDHNLSTRALDVKVFKYDPLDIELKYPIVVGMEYPSDNQVKIYLTEEQFISVLISRI